MTHERLAEIKEEQQITWDTDTADCIAEIERLQKQLAEAIELIKYAKDYLSNQYGQPLAIWLNAHKQVGE